MQADSIDSDQALFDEDNYDDDDNRVCLRDQCCASNYYAVFLWSYSLHIYLSVCSVDSSLLTLRQEVVSYL